MEYNSNEISDGSLSLINYGKINQNLTKNKITLNQKTTK